MLRLTEVRIAGFGGQGVILAASVVGRAATIYNNRYATMTQSFGPESRGGACSAQLIISGSPVLYPYVTASDILVVMSQEAFTKFHGELKPGGVMLVEEDLVRLSDIKPGTRVYGIPATRFAEELGKKMVLNIVMVGFFGAVTQLIPADALRNAIADAVPKRFRELNLLAFDKGYDHGLKLSTERTENELATLLPQIGD
jgi:2-oxoglutarate ferredoxin oxidoreductase subunit gamma